MNETNQTSANLEKLRGKIGELDDKLLELLNERAGCSIAIGDLKGSASDEVLRSGREKELLKGLLERNSGPLPPEHLLSIYKEIISSSRALQHQQRVAFLGPEGTFSHVAGLEYFGSAATFEPQNTFDGIFRAVEAHACDYGIVPLENSLQGGVGQALDLFLTHNVHIKAEFFCRIRHSLLSCAKSLSDIETVYSHPQPLAQCGKWLAKNLPDAQLVAVDSSATAARMVTDNPQAAAIAHIALGDKLQISVLAEGLEDMPNNWTRFVLIGLVPADRPGPDKSTLLFSVKDAPGSLSAVLNTFTEAGINLKKLESRPMSGKCWEYMFFVDLECDIEDPRYAGIFDELKKHCDMLRLLGAYPSGKYVQDE